MSGDEPLGATILVAVAALLVFLEGVFFGFASEIAGAVGAGDVGIALGAIALVSIVLGLILALLAVLLYRWPDSHRGLGIAAIILSLLCLFVGGGFYLGTFLGVVGGILGIVWEDPADDEPLPDWGTTLQPSASAGGSSGPWVPAAPANECANCGAPLTPGATVCSNCETPVRTAYRAPTADAASPAPRR